MTIVRMGSRELELGGSYMTNLRESNDILNDEAALRERLREDGYLLIREFHERERVLAARKELLTKLADQGKLHPDAPLEVGLIGGDGRGSAFLGAAQDDKPELLKLVNSDRVMGFFDRLLGGPSMTFDYKWARAVGTGDSTGAHYDVVYMGRGTKNLYTVWTPLGDVSYEMGGLALCLGSQHFKPVIDTYGNMDVDRDKVTGWFSDDPVEIVDKFGGRWATTEYRAGDALIFGMYTLHGSLTNQTDRYRLSVDTRYQLASDPADERWVGKKPKAHYAWFEGKTVPMEEARKKWGV